MNDPQAPAKAAANKTKSLLLQMCRHLLNPEELPLLTWGSRGMDLLGEVRQLMPKDYDRVVKGKVQP
jgi:hypothetical protein